MSSPSRAERGRVAAPLGKNSALTSRLNGKAATQPGDAGDLALKIGLPSSLPEERLLLVAILRDNTKLDDIG